MTQAEQQLEQRMVALGRANEVRAQRAQLKRDVADGSRSLADLLLAPPDVMEGIPIIEILQWLPRIGAIKAKKMLAVNVIGAQTHLRHLSPARRALLAEMLKPMERRLAA